jgi:hypothetical protein
VIRWSKAFISIAQAVCKLFSLTCHEGTEGGGGCEIIAILIPDLGFCWDWVVKGHVPAVASPEKSPLPLV